MQRLTLFFTLSLMLALAAFANAAGLAATAQLSPDATTVGRPVVLSITISGSQDVTPPALPEVEGLQSRYVGSSRSVEVRNMKMSVSVSFNYQVAAGREGTFTIPSIQIEVEGQRVSTEPLTLRVGAGIAQRPGAQPIPRAQPVVPGQQPQQPQQQQGGAATAGENELIYAELIIPKEKAYVGELVPVEVRFYFNHQIGFQPLQPPIFTGEGFTSTKFTEPSQTDQMINGEPYRIISYRTAISGVHPGKISVGPVEQLTLIRKPVRRADPFFQDDIFDQFFGRGGMSQDSQENIRARPVDLEILPLPEAGKPESFGGAVGQFSVKSSAEPTKAATGEPVTVQSTVSGRGNFDRVGSSVFAESADWRTYPPKDEFKPGDDIGFTGTKSFEQVFTAQRPVGSLPLSEFAWFDPVTGKYQVWKSPELPVEISGGSLVPDATPEPVEAAKPTPAAPEKEVATDILHILTTPLPWSAAPHSILTSTVFLGAQGGAAALLLAAVGFVVIRRNQKNNAQSEKAVMARAVDVEWQRVRDSRLPESETLKAAMAWLVLVCRQAAPAAMDPGQVPTPAMVLGLIQSDADLKNRLGRWVDQHDSMRYSGRSGSEAAMAPSRRKELIDDLNAAARFIGKSR